MNFSIRGLGLREDGLFEHWQAVCGLEHVLLSGPWRLLLLLGVETERWLVKQVAQRSSRWECPGRGTQATGDSNITVVPAGMSRVATSARPFPCKDATATQDPDSFRVEAIAPSRSFRRDMASEKNCVNDW